MGVSYQHQSVTEEKLKDFASNDYFVESWGKSTSFNIGAFIFTLFWLAYRKMYLYTFLYVVIHSVLFYILTATVDSNIYAWIVNLALCIVFGFLGNRLYLHFAESKVARIARMYADPGEQQERISQAGGTSLGAVYVVGIYYAVIFVIYMNI